MSTEEAAGLSAAEQRWGISREELKRRQRMHVDATKDDERICDDCGARVTITDSGEVGHHRGRKEHRRLCPHYSGPFAEPDRDAMRQETLGGW